MQAQGQELELGSNQFGMVGFQEAGSPPQVNFVIDPIELHDMVLLVATKQPQFGGKVLASDYSGKHESTQKHIERYKAVQEYVEKGWSGISLISTDGSRYNDMNEGDMLADHKTELEKHLPYMFELVEKFD